MTCKARYRQARNVRARACPCVQRGVRTLQRSALYGINPGGRTHHHGQMRACGPPSTSARCRGSVVGSDHLGFGRCGVPLAGWWCAVQVAINCDRIAVVRSQPCPAARWWQRSDGGCQTRLCLSGGSEATGERQVQQAGTMEELRVKLDELATNLKSLDTFRVVDIAVLPGDKVRRLHPLATSHTSAK